MSTRKPKGDPARVNADLVRAAMLSADDRGYPRTPDRIWNECIRLRARADACMAAAFCGPDTQCSDGFGVTVYCRAPREGEGK